MQQRTEGEYRILPGRDAERRSEAAASRDREVEAGGDGEGGDEDEDEWLFLDVESAEPTYVPAASAPDLEVGNRVEATLRWDDGPAVEEHAVLAATRFRFVRTDEPVFQAAQECFEAARQAGEAMNSRVTYSTDNEANGVVYTFADQPGQRDLFAEFRDGVKPLEPLVGRVAESADPPFSVWVLDPQEPFVLVYIVLDPDGILEETMRDTYL